MGSRLSVVNALRGFLPARAVLHEEEDTRPYECDGLTAYRQLPMVVVLPETEEQVRKILQTCHAMGVPVAPNVRITDPSASIAMREDNPVA